MSQFHTFKVLQLLAAVHLFAYQLYNLRVGFFVAHVIPHWAPSWYSFLLAVEGFTLTFVQLKGPKPDDMGPIAPYLRQQLSRLYPVYFVSLFFSCVSLGRVPWESVWSNVFPVSTWPGTTLQQKTWNGGAWFVSDLAFNLLSWRFAYPKLLSLSEKDCWCVLGVAVSAVYFRVLAIALGLLGADVMWAPYNFCHFLGGMCVAKLFVARDTNHGTQRDVVMLEIWPHRWAFSGVLAFTLLLGIFAYGPHPFHLHKLAPSALRTGVMLPYHLVLIWMLALEEGPLASACRWQPLVLAGDMSYAMYVLLWNFVQLVAPARSPIYALPLTGLQKFSCVILPVSLVIAGLVHCAVERPLRHWTRGQDVILNRKED